MTSATTQPPPSPAWQSTEKSNTKESVFLFVLVLRWFIKGLRERKLFDVWVIRRDGACEHEYFLEILTWNCHEMYLPKIHKNKLNILWKFHYSYDAVKILLESFLKNFHKIFAKMTEILSCTKYGFGPDIRPIICRISGLKGIVKWSK